MITAADLTREEIESRTFLYGGIEYEFCTSELTAKAGHYTYWGSASGKKIPTTIRARGLSKFVLKEDQAA